MQNTRLPKILMHELDQYNKADHGGQKQNWLQTYNTLLSKYGSSVEHMKQIIGQKNKVALKNFMTTVATNLTNHDMKLAMESNSYKYYVNPFITHNPPSYGSATWPIHLRRLNAALRNQSQKIYFGKNKKIQLYKFKTCPLCNSREKYSLYDILTLCEMLKPYRVQSACQSPCYPIDQYVQTFSYLSQNQFKNIYNLLFLHVSQ